ncbi:MAG: hypothetical protein ACWGSQ_14550 [Longimicrobiales bacterium]
MNPKAKANILVEALPDETLVYDLDRHRAHCLNPTAALLLARADGERDLPALTRLLKEELGEPATEEIVRLGLERLRRARLLEWDGEGIGREGMSRRQAIRRLAGVGIALPSVLTVAAAQGPPGTHLTPAACRKDPMALGRCCTNGRLCVQDGVERKCVGPPC